MSVLLWVWLVLAVFVAGLNSVQPERSYGGAALTWLLLGFAGLCGLGLRVLT